MILIIEGANKAGKSTLIEELAKKDHHVIVRNSRFFKDESSLDSSMKKMLINTRMEVELEMLEDVSKCFENHILVFDRFHATEFVYSQIERNYVNDKMFEFDERLSKLNSRMVLMTSDYNHIDDPYLKNKYLSIQDSMGYFYSLSKMEKQVYKASSKLDFEIIAKDIIEMI